MDKVFIDKQLDKEDIPTKLLYDGKIAPDTRLLWPILHGYGRTAFPGIPAISGLLGRGQTRTKECLRELEEAKWLKIFSGARSGKSNDYYLTIPELWEALEPREGTRELFKDTTTGGRTPAGIRPGEEGEVSRNPTGGPSRNPTTIIKGLKVLEPNHLPSEGGDPGEISAKDHKRQRFLALIGIYRKHVPGAKVSDYDAGQLNRLIDSLANPTDQEFEKAARNFRLDAPKWTSNYSLHSLCKRFNVYLANDPGEKKDTVAAFQCNVCLKTITLEASKYSCCGKNWCFEHVSEHDKDQHKGESPK